MLNKIFLNLLKLTVVFLPLYILRFKIGPIPTTFLEVLIYLTFIFYLVAKNYRKIKFDRLFWIGILLLAITLLAGFIDPDKVRGLGLWKAYFFDGFLLFVMVRTVIEAQRQKLILSLILSGLLTSVAAIILYLLGVRSADNRLLDLDRLSSNYLAMYLSPILILSLARLIERFREKKNLYLEFGSAAVLIVALILTGSRGAILALAAGIIILIYGSLKKANKVRLARVILIFSSIILVAGSIWIFKPDWSDHGRKATSSNIRYYIFSTSVEMIKLNPIWGVGLGSYQDYFKTLTKDRVNYPEYISPQALTAHNLYLQIYLTCGLFGLAIFIIFICNLRFWELKNLAVSAAFISLLVYGLVDTPLFRNDLAAIFWLITAIMASYMTYPSHKNSTV